jgi:hypothetical protein
LQALISGSSQASGHRINLDTHVLNTRNEKIVRVPSEKQLAQSHRVTNVAGPVSNSKQLAHIGPSAGLLDPNGPSKKRKKPKAWSKEEDADLAAGVQKYGEGNWEDILHKCNFDNTRTPDQLSQVILCSPCQLCNSMHYPAILHSYLWVCLVRCLTCHSLPNLSCLRLVLQFGRLTLGKLWLK